MEQAHPEPDRNPGVAVSRASPPPSEPAADEPPTPLDDSDRLLHLTEATADELDVDRVGVWLREGGNRARLRRIHLYDRASGAHRSGGLLSADRFPAYFEALDEEEELAVEDVANDARVRELVTPYARPLGIGAWLDVPIRDEAGEHLGLLRLEQRGGPRSWDGDDRRRAREAARAATGRGGDESGTRPEPASDDRHAAGLDPDAADSEGPTVGFERAAVESNAAGIGVLDPDGTVRRGNRALARAAGFDSVEALAGTNLVRARFASERTWRGLLGRLEREGRVSDHEAELDLPDEESPRWLLLAASLLDEDGEPPRVLATALDVTVRKQREMRLRHQAYRDPLTGLANRRLLRETAEQTLALADRHERTAGLLYLDLSGFKEVNDTFGHDVGDLVLVAVADRLRDLVRESDLAARVGGDEFAVLLPEIDDEAGALRAGRRLLDELNRPIGVAEEEIRVGGKAGIALYPRDGRDLDELMRNADRAMYRTREREDRSVAVHGEDLQGHGGGAGDEEADGETADDSEVGPDTAPDPGPTLRAAPDEDGAADAPRRDDEPAADDGPSAPDGSSGDALREALDRGDLVLHYQPIVRRLQEPAPGAEALLRWNHPDRGLRDASSFLEEARADGLLPELDRWVLRRAVEQARRWSDAGVERWVSVNVSAETLAGRGLPAFLDDIVVESGLRRELLLIDATLSADAPRLEAAIPALRNLRAKGFRVALDYSGPAEGLASSFEGAPVDVVKVDRAVLDVVSPETVTELLGAAVLVKRVETEADYEAVTRRNVPLLQGFFAGRPVPAAELDEETGD